jgi:hypothetical protein
VQARSLLTSCVIALLPCCRCSAGGTTPPVAPGGNGYPTGPTCTGFQVEAGFSDRCQECTIQPNGSFGNDPQTAADSAACVGLCRATAKCQGASFSPSRKQCYLKDRPFSAYTAAQVGKSGSWVGISRCVTFPGNSYSAYARATGSTVCDGCRSRQLQRAPMCTAGLRLTTLDSAGAVQPLRQLAAMPTQRIPTALGSRWKQVTSTSARGARFRRTGLLVTQLR